MNRRVKSRVKYGAFVFFLIGCLVSSLSDVVGVGSSLGKGSALAAVEAGKSQGAAPDFELADLSGAPFRLSKFKGDKPVLLYFWATWCSYCVAVKPQIAKLREKFSTKEMEILGINVGEGDSLERLKRYQEGHPVAWPILYDTGSKVSRDYHVQGIPLFVLVNKEGNMVYRGNDPPKDPTEYLR